MQLGGQRGPTSGCHSSAGVSRYARASPGQAAGQSSPQFSSSAAPESESPQGKPDQMSRHRDTGVYVWFCARVGFTLAQLEGRELWAQENKVRENIFRPPTCETWPVHGGQSVKSPGEPASLSNLTWSIPPKVSCRSPAGASVLPALMDA